MPVAELLTETGSIARKLPGYELRPPQIKMAEAVADALAQGHHLLVEAGTGVGKSFAYLVPAIEHVVAQGGRVVVSTHTIALQEQLIHKDIPLLQSILPRPFVAELVKGRSNYLGIRRLARTSVRQKELFDAAGTRKELWRIEDWARTTADGSLADLPEQPDDNVWERVRSDGDDCMGRRCPYFEKCFYQRARRRAIDAQVLVVNHALLFADLAVKSHGASILPSYDYVVLDEAHTVERVAGEHLGVHVTNAQVRHLLATLHNPKTGRGVLGGRVGRKLVPVVAAADRAVQDYFHQLLVWRESLQNWNGRLREPPPIEQRVAPALLDLADGLRRARGDLDDEEAKSEYGGMVERCNDLASRLQQWHEQKRAGSVYWMTVTGSHRPRVTLAARPIDVAAPLKAMLFDKVRSAILTSATLTTAAEEPFAYLRERIGLGEARSLALGSPFHYREQLRVFVEAALPDPSQGEAFLAAACEAIKKYVRQSEGRAFVLFTSYDMMDQCAGMLANFFAEENMPLWVQGAGLPRSMMLEKFRSVARSVLFGTDTFWTGVDVPGEALSNVIIVKLPFAVPNDPFVEARTERIQQEGGNPFMDYQVPEAVLKFRQGIGRLIRSRSDRGIVVILDPRVCTKPYGRTFLKALPDCDVVINR